MSLHVLRSVRPMWLCHWQGVLCTLCILCRMMLSGCRWAPLCHGWGPAELLAAAVWQGMVCRRATQCLAGGSCRLCMLCSVPSRRLSGLADCGMALPTAAGGWQGVSGQACVLCRMILSGASTFVRQPGSQLSCWQQLLGKEWCAGAPRSAWRHGLLCRTCHAGLAVCSVA